MLTDSTPPLIFDWRNLKLDMKLYILIFSLFYAMSANTQDLTGEYFMEGQREMVSIIKINADSTFNFYFAYGAADRYSNGYWIREGGKLVLTTPVKSEPNFVLVTSKHAASKKFTVKITDANKQVLPFVSVYVKGQNTEMHERANGEGEVEFADADVDTIYLQHEIWLNEPVAVPVADKKKNYFEFRINPDIMNIDFKDIVLIISNNELTGGHPLMKGEFHYVKNE